MWEEENVLLIGLRGSPSIDSSVILDYILACPSLRARKGLLTICDDTETLNVCQLSRPLCIKCRPPVHL